MGNLNSEVQQDDNLEPLTAAYEPNSDRIVIPQAASATQDPQSGRWYGPLAVQTSGEPVANQRVNAQSGDFVAGSIVDLATLNSTVATAANQATGNTSLSSIATNASNINTALAGTLTTKRVTSPSGGSTPYHAISAASDNATNVKNGAGQIYDLSISNAASAARYFKLYDKASNPASTDTPKRTLQIPANATLICTFPVGLAFASGIGFRATTGIADNDTGAVGAADLSIDLGYA